MTAWTVRRTTVLTAFAAGLLACVYCASLDERPSTAEPSTSEPAPPGARAVAQAPATGRTRSTLQKSNPEVSCGNTTCGAGEVCCYSGNAFCTAASERCPEGTVPKTCDDLSDCAPGEVCCGHRGGFSCQPRCEKVGWQLCRADAECSTGACRHGSCAQISDASLLGPVGRMPKTRPEDFDYPSRFRPPRDARPPRDVRLPR